MRFSTAPLVALIFAFQMLCCSAARAEDVTAQQIRATANADGRMEVFAVAAGGSLYHRWENPDPADWSPWNLNAPMQATRIEAVRGDGGALFAFALSDHRLVVRRQAGAGSSFEAASTVLGTGLNSLAVSLQANQRMAAFAIDQNGMLEATREISDNVWQPLTTIGGHDLLGGRTVSGILAPFIVTPNALAAAMAPNGFTDVFAIGGDHQLYLLPFFETSGRPNVWTTLGGSNLTEVSAESGGGIPSVLAIDQAGMLRARTQTFNTWQPWQLVFPYPVTEWSAAPDTFGSVIVVARSGQQLHVRHRDSTGKWKVGEFGDVPIAGPTDEMLQAISLTSSDQHRLLLAGINTVGEVFTLPLGAVANAAGYTNDRPWSWLGGVTVSPNVPEFVAKVAFCGIDSASDIIPDLKKQIVTDLNATGLTGLSRHLSVELVCNADKTQTLAIWLNRQPTPSAIPVLSLIPEGGGNLGSISLRATREGLERIVAESFAAAPKTIVLGRHTTINVHSASLQIDNSSLSVHLSATYHGDDLVHPDLSVVAKAKVTVKDGSTNCAAKASVSSSELTGIVGWLGSFMPLFVPFTVNKLFNDQYNSEKNQLQDATALACQLVDVFPTDILLAPTAPASGPLQKLQFCYGAAEFRASEGLTVYGDVSSVARVPRVQWFPLPGPARGLEAALHPAFDFIATTADMRDPKLSWTVSPGLTLTNVTSDGRVVNISLDKLFPTLYQPGTVWGTVTVNAVDGDGQTAVFTNPLTIEAPNLLGVEPTPDKAADAVPPALPRTC